jgi:hypothetical protein
LYNYAIIQLYREFENLMLDALVGAINNDSTTLSDKTGIKFPDHLNNAVCQYLIVGIGYFDFKGRDGLIRTVKQFVPEDHYLVDVVKNGSYKTALEQLCALRNFAAHESSKSKQEAKKVTNNQRIQSSGSWLKTNHRFEQIQKTLKELAEEIKQKAPY